MSYIGRDPQYGAFEKQTLTADSSTTTFTLDYTVGSSSSLLVSVAGVHQEPEVAYNLATNGTQITFTAAPTAGDTVFVIFLGVALEVATIGSGVITSRTELAEQAAEDDLLLIYDTSTGGLKKIQKSNIETFTSVVQDTTPQLGADLDVNGNAIGTGSQVVEIKSTMNSTLTTTGKALVMGF